ncbi:nuclease bacteriocin klebicin B, partial [Klebsiella pneumoniae]
KLRGIAGASLVGPVVATAVGLFWSRDVGIGSDVVPGRDISGLMPGDALSLPDLATLIKAADSKTGVSMPVRGRIIVREGDYLESQFVRTPVAGSVPVVRAALDKATGYWGYTLPAIQDVPGQTILVSPSDAPGVNGPLGLAGPVPLPETIIHTGGQTTVPQGGTVTVSPAEDDIDFNDLILVFPPESGLKPLYVMYRSPRNMPGTASGKGQNVGNNWMGGTSTGDGAPVPSQIADKLRGKAFGSFDSFRRAFWKAVAADPDLSKQFYPDDIERMKLGRAPTVRFRDSVGKRVKVELHHKVEISKGGDVYNVDNLNALTPKRHIEIHKGN